MESEGKVGNGMNYRHEMKYPYTHSAQLAQFPYKWLWKKSWFFRYLIYGTIVSMPIMYKIQKLSYSPENVEKWAEIRRKQFRGEH